jgi:pilus assembly protein CpaB
MNRTRMMVLAGISLVLSVLVALGAYRMLDARANPVVRQGRIVVAARKLPVGARLAEGDVKAVTWPAESPVEGGHADPAEVIGRAVIVGVVPGEPLIETKLAAKEAGAGITTVIPEGMRAVAVKVNEVIGVAGFVLPGSRVDVIVTGSPTTSGTADTAKVILENIQVLSAGRQVEADASGTPQDVPVVTLLVTPADSQKLALAASEGRIQLALRNPLDEQRQEPAAVNKTALFAGTAAAPVPKGVARQTSARAPSPEPARLVVEVIQGGKRETVSFGPKEPARP